MAIRDILSNYNPTVVDNQLTLTATNVIGTELVTGAVDLRNGLTTLITYFLFNGFGIPGNLSIEYSADEAFTNPVSDPGDLGNDILNDSAQSQIGTPISIDSANYYMNIVNPPQGVRYVRLKLTQTTDSDDGNTFSVVSIVKSGPQRFVSAE